MAGLENQVWVCYVRTRELAAVSKYCFVHALGTLLSRGRKCCREALVQSSGAQELGDDLPCRDQVGEAMVMR